MTPSTRRRLLERAGICPCETDVERPGPHIAACRWADATYNPEPPDAWRDLRAAVLELPGLRAELAGDCEDSGAPELTAEQRAALGRMLDSRSVVDAARELGATLGRVRVKRIARPRAHDRRPAASDAQRELEWGAEYDPRQTTLPWAPRRGQGGR